MKLEQLNNPQNDSSRITFDSEVRGFHHGQMDGTIVATQNGRRIAYLDYSEYEGKPNIQFITVDEDYRRQKIAAGMLKYLQGLYPAEEIEWGMQTPDGDKLYKSTRFKTLENPEYQALTLRLKKLKSKRDQLERSGNWDRMNQFHDLIDRIEYQLRDIQPQIKLIVEGTSVGKKGKVNTPFLAPTEENIKKAQDFVLQKWKERAEEYNLPTPTDLSKSCKASSMFAQRIFGGKIKGSYSHQYVELDNGKILDLNIDAEDVKALDIPHRHDKSFFGNPEHKQSMRSLEPRVDRWVKEFSNLIPVTEGIVSSNSILVGNKTLPVKPASDDVHEVMNSNMQFGKLIGNKILPISKVHGGVDLRDTRQQARVEALKTAMMSEAGYVSRLIVDQSGDVVEGQHRFDALTQLGAKNVPVTIIKDLAANIDVPGLSSAIQKAQPMRSDNVHQIIGMMLENLDEEGTVAKVREEWEAPRGYERAWRAALDFLESKPLEEAAVRSADLYHGTSVASLLDIIKDNCIESGGFNISLSRDLSIAKKFADSKSGNVIEVMRDIKGGDQYEDVDFDDENAVDQADARIIPAAYIEKNLYDHGIHGGAILVLDRDLLRQRYKLSPHSDDPHGDHKWEREERITKDIRPVKPLIKHIILGRSFVNIADNLLHGNTRAGIDPQPQYAEAIAYIKSKAAIQETIDEAKAPPLPEPWNPKNVDPRLLTTQEYLNLVDPEEKSHPSTAYDNRVKDFDWVKKTDYPKLLKRILLKGMYFEFRLQDRTLKYHVSDPDTHELKRDKDNNIIPMTPEQIKALGLPPIEYSIAIFNEDEECVGKSGDEWGAMLLQVASEYRGFGLGTILGELARKFEPGKTSGGFTGAGKQNFIRMHREMIRKAQTTGFYSELMRDKKITPARVKEILASADLKQKPKTSEMNLGVQDPKDWLIMNNDDGAFVLYDKKLQAVYTDNLYEWGERFILGYILIRINDLPGRTSVGIVVKFGGNTDKIKKSLLMMAASYCLKENVKLAVDPDDIGLIDPAKFTISDEADPSGYKRKMVTINHPIDLNLVSSPEKRFRKAFDRYDEFKYTVLELAEGKFGQ